VRRTISALPSVTRDPPVITSILMAHALSLSKSGFVEFAPSKECFEAVAQMPSPPSRPESPGQLPSEQPMVTPADAESEVFCLTALSVGNVTRAPARVPGLQILPPDARNSASQTIRVSARVRLPCRKFGPTAHLRPGADSL
jgi:hypothetical protein